MRVTIRLFARLRDLAGAGELVARRAAGRHASERSGRRWSREYPALGAYSGSVSCAVNADYARMPAHVAEGDEVAFLPPVSGG